MSNDKNKPIRADAYREDYTSWQYEERLECYHDCLVVPQTTLSAIHDFNGFMYRDWNVYNGGVYSSAGDIVETALHQGKIGIRHVPDESPDTLSEVRSLSGSWVFGGFYFRHIGHMLTESTGRLWALGADDRHYDGIVFICWNGAKAVSDQRSVKEWLEHHAAAAGRSVLFKQVLDFFGAPERVHFVVDPITIEKLTVPSELMALLPYRDLMGGHPTYRSHIQARLTRVGDAASIDHRTRIYVSRSRLDRVDACFFMEDLLDARFLAEGYNVLYPEKLTLGDQIAAYKSASHIVLAAGSAAHVVALAVTGHQHIAVIARYVGQNDQFSLQLRSMGAPSACFIDCLIGSFLPESLAERSAANIHPSAAVCMLDFNRLWQELAQRGFVSSTIDEVPNSVYHQRTEAVCSDLQNRYGLGKFMLVERV